MSPGIHSLAELKKGTPARVVAVDGNGDIPLRLLEMGLLEGAHVEVVHEAPFSRDPIAVRVRGSMIALRRAEASCVRVAVRETP